MKVIGKKIAVLIGTPCRLDYAIDAELNAWVETNLHRGVAYGWKFLPSRSAEDGRNAIIRWMFKECPAATHILFMDSDTVPIEEMALEKMIRNNAPIVAGMTPVYYRENSNAPTLSGKFRWNVLIDAANHPPIGRPLAISEVPSKPFYAELVGGTTILIRKDVLEKIGDPWFKTERDDVHNDIVIGEDYFFCQKAKRAGYKVLVDPAVQCHHRQYLDLYELIGTIKKAAQDPDFWKRAELVEDELKVIGAVADELKEEAA